MKTLCEAVKRCLADAGLLRADARLLCGVSGGADSVALLHALCRVRRDAGFELRAAHVQHGLRGEASREDERFVRSLCASLGVALDVVTLALNASMEDAGIETLARDERRRAFSRLLRGQGAHALLLAHHRDDQAETVLMHLLRGSGASGLCGMRPCASFAGGLVLRPFLALPKAALLDALAREGLTHREDASNREAVTPRNALRLRVLPQLEALYPGASLRIAQTAERIGADEAELAEAARAALTRACYAEPPFVSLRLDELRSLSTGLLRRVLRLAYRQALDQRGLTPSEQALPYADTLALAELAYAPEGASRNLPCGLRAVTRGRFLHLLDQSGPPAPLPEAPQAVEKGRAAYQFRHGRVLQSDAPVGSPVPRHPREAVLTPEVLSLHPVLRLPLPEDRVRPLGASGSKPLRRFWTDRKVDPLLRWRLPVLAAGNEVLWAPGLCVSERLRLTQIPEGSIALSSAFDLDAKE